MAEQYEAGRWHWLIHDKDGEPSALRAIILSIFALTAAFAGAAQAAHLVDFTALF